MAKIRTRARAVDMLGRQQIAGTQNAINELFKNAHDAYAKNVRIDFFEDENTLIIRDDGVGMTKEDFEEKWLVLGTESKAAENRDLQFRPKGAKLRQITGEKGIGRLAIALLGRQVLVLTRAARADGLHDLVMGLVHWGLFELPGLNLDEIEIPVKTLPGGTLPSAEQIEAIKTQLLKCIEKLSKDHRELKFAQIAAEMKAFQPDPADLDRFFAGQDEGALRLAGDSTGTHFIIAPANPVLEMELAVEERNQDWSFRKQLLGFSDHVFGSVAEASISTSFQKWPPGALAGSEMLDAETFFTKEELESKSDHLLRGTVNKFGQFKGSLRVYEQKYDDVVVPWSEAGGVQTECGPFDVVFGYSMGRESESLMVGDAYKELSDKLDKIGGIYVYRDGIRILPYGDFSFDWLEVEKRRSKGAGYYFFSSRRMFGAVLLSREANAALQEKAGREGFQQNRSYRQLRDILVNVLTYLASEFFRSGKSEKGDLFEKTQAEMRRRAEALARQQKRSGEKRKLFAKALETFFEASKAGAPDRAVDELKKLTRSRMEAASRIEDQDRAAASLIRAEREAITGLNGLRDRFTCKKPAGVALTKELTREWDGYRIEKDRLDIKVFGPCEEEIARTLGEVAKQARLYVDQRKRLEDRIKALSDERQKQLQNAANMARDSASDTRTTVFDITQKAMLALDLKVKQIESDLNSTDLDALSPGKIEALRKGWEDQLSEIESHHREALMQARDMLAALAENLRASDGQEPAEVMEALEGRMLALEEEADENFEMVQLGLAVAIINHEFAAAIRNVRRSVQELGQVSQRSTTLRPLYQSIRHNFEHLDGHLKLFTPLQRRLYRSAQEIAGKSIRNYVTDLFGNRLERHKVTLECTDAFLSAKVECYPSTVFPAVINLVDNALFWLGNTKEDRRIRFDVSSGDIIIANTGAEIEERDQQRIFERGFSRKPGGRGLGLFISARALEAEKMHLRLDLPPPGFSVAFHISAPTLKIQP
jgi:signal transduction histidine kinase